MGRFKEAVERSLGSLRKKVTGTPRQERKQPNITLIFRIEGNKPAKFYGEGD